MIPQNEKPITANLLRITSSYFCAGLELKKRPEFNRCAPIIHYMKTWDWKRIKDYAGNIGWKLEKVA